MIGLSMRPLLSAGRSPSTESGMFGARNFISDNSQPELFRQARSRILGRLAPGALADMIIIDLFGRDSLRYGLVRDPVKSLVECGVGHDVDTVVGGKIVMQGRRIVGVDFAALRAEAQAAGENVWATLPEWHPLGRTAESACPWCYPMAQ
jgi:hypothetical protein